jgi:hypothetical protein
MTKSIAEIQIEVIADRVSRDGRYTHWCFASSADRELFLQAYAPSPRTTLEMVGDREMIARTRPVYRSECLRSFSESIAAMGGHRRDG